MKCLTRRTILVTAQGALAVSALPARAAKKYGPGVTDTEIKIGNTGPYSGPLANGSPFPLSEKAYFEMINAQGGINGRKITWISYDDGYSPPKTVEMTRKLVEEGPSPVSIRLDWNPNKQRGLALPERKEGAATVSRHGRL